MSVVSERQNRKCKNREINIDLIASKIELELIYRILAKENMNTEEMMKENNKNEFLQNYKY